MALIADIHGNATSLRGVLDEMNSIGVDSVVCLGDLAANGPQPKLAIEMIQESGCRVVLGNTDQNMLEVPYWWRDPASVDAPESARRVVAVSAWCADQLEDAHRSFLADLPTSLEVDLGEAGLMLCFHGSPRSTTDVITDSTPVETIAAMLDGARQPFLAGGHTHVPLVAQFGAQTIINPGSVGLPFAAYGYAGEVEVLNHAAYAIVEVDGEDVSVDLRRVAIDTAALEHSVLTSAMPHAEWWLDLRP